jgi:hypothetical protein
MELPPTEEAARSRKRIENALGLPFGRNGGGVLHVHVTIMSLMSLVALDAH